MYDVEHRRCRLPVELPCPDVDVPLAEPTRSGVVAVVVVVVGRPVGESRVPVSLRLRGLGGIGGFSRLVGDGRGVVGPGSEGPRVSS